MFQYAKLASITTHAINSWFLTFSDSSCTIWEVAVITWLCATITYSCRRYRSFKALHNHICEVERPQARAETRRDKENLHTNNKEWAWYRHKHPEIGPIWAEASANQLSTGTNGHKPAWHPEEQGHPSPKVVGTSTNKPGVSKKEDKTAGYHQEHAQTSRFWVGTPGKKPTLRTNKHERACCTQEQGIQSPSMGRDKHEWAWYELIRTENDAKEEQYAGTKSYVRNTWLWKRGSWYRRTGEILTASCSEKATIGAWTELCLRWFQQEERGGA